MTSQTITTPDAILPATARKWVYRGAIFAGAVVFIVALVLDATGRNVIDGITIDPETGIVALVLAALGALAHVNLSNGPAILTAAEDASPKVAEVIEAAKTTVDKAETLAAANPDLTNTLRAELVKMLPANVKPGKKTKAELIAIINGAKASN